MQDDPEADLYGEIRPLPNVTLRYTSVSTHTPRADTQYNHTTAWVETVNQNLVPNNTQDHSQVSSADLINDLRSSPDEEDYLPKGRPNEPRPDFGTWELPPISNQRSILTQILQSPNLCVWKQKVHTIHTLEKAQPKICSHPRMRYTRA